MTTDGTPRAEAAPEPEAFDARDASAVFALLGDEHRVAIVRELVAARAPLAFAELYDRVDVEDSGQFNYHLRKLRGTLVEKTTAGYRLTETGERAAITADVVTASD